MDHIGARWGAGIVTNTRIGAVPRHLLNCDHASQVEAMRYTTQSYSVSFWERDGLVGVSVVCECDADMEVASRVRDGYRLLGKFGFTHEPSRQSPVTHEKMIEAIKSHRDGQEVQVLEKEKPREVTGWINADVFSGDSRTFFRSDEDPYNGGMQFRVKAKLTEVLDD